MTATAMLPLLTTLSLLFGSTTAPSPEPADDQVAEAPAPTITQPDFDAAIEELRQVDSEANRDPAAAAAALAEAIANLDQFAPQLAANDEGRELRQFARLNLARGHLLAQDPESAARVMDETIREAMDQDVPAADFGPSLKKLYAERLEALEPLGRARLIVRCSLPCTIYVNESEVGPEPPPLRLGTYRVWVESSDGEREPLRESVVLDEADATRELVFARIIEEPIDPGPELEPKQRIMPRGAEVLLTILGAGVTVTGAVLIGINDKASDTNTAGVGAATLIAGIGVLATGVITLGIDERRLSRGGVDRKAMVTWTMKF